ncbi:hypothetical protein [Streptomyces swartbergensis]|uniref:hypothetical protein n=1 Tax=Streptomyces swartbergensis TaxID=487165 RepID=UPI001FCA269B|nr:hypothetical protein [Streptomyces swartbergensis]
MLDLSDQYYAMVIGALQASLQRQDKAGGVLMGRARQMMTNIHEINRMLASRGVGPRFTLPSPVERADGADRATAAANGQLVREAAAAASRAREAIGSLGEPAVRSMVIRHQAEAADLLAALAHTDAGASRLTGTPTGGQGDG